MERVLRLNNTDQRITYSNNWDTVSNTAPDNGSYASTTTDGAELFFPFRGTVLSPLFLLTLNGL
jgi:hypothetical protein